MPADVTELVELAAEIGTWSCRAIVAGRLDQCGTCVTCRGRQLSADPPPADELEQLRTALAEACDAIIEVGGAYAIRTKAFRAKLDEWRCMANPLLCPDAGEPIARQEVADA